LVEALSSPCFHARIDHQAELFLHGPAGLRELEIIVIRLVDGELVRTDQVVGNMHVQIVGVLVHPAYPLMTG
jgi:hypothetical protein